MRAWRPIAIKKMEPIVISGQSGSVSWRDNHLLKGLAGDQLDALAEHIQRQSFDASEVVFREGDKGKRIFLIESGEVAVFREDERFRLNTLGPGESFGAMALLNNIPRSASVMATQPSELCYLTIGALKKLAAEGQEGIYLQITKNHLYDLYEVVNKSDHQIIDSIKRELKASKASIAFASFFTTIVFLISLYVFMLRSSIGWIEHLRDSTYVTSGMLLFTLGILILMMKRNQYPIRYYGLNLKNWRKAVPEALMWSLGFILFATAAKAIWLWLAPGHEGQALWSLPGYKDGSIRQSLIYAGIYTLFAPVQEFFARGVIQGTLQKFLTGRLIKARAIAISTLLFSVTHVHLDLAFAFMTIIPSIFWGIMYARQDSLLGVSISHILIGLYITFVLGFI